MRIAWWLWLLALLLVAGYAVPYTLLSGVESWQGSLLFWTIFGVAVWAALIAAVSRWKVSGGSGAGGEV